MKTININIIFYIIYLLIYVITVSLFGFGNSISNFRYYSLMLSCVISAIMLLNKENKVTHVNKKFLLSIIVAIVFLIFSYQKSFLAGIPLSIRTYVQISLFLLPTLYAFYLSNMLNVDNLIKLMKISLVILIFAYFFDFKEKNHHILQFFSINNWLSIDYIHSNSFTESNNWSEAFLQLFLFFYYFYNTKENKRKNLKPYMILSFVFTMLSFKRLAILVALFYPLFGKKIINWKTKKDYKYILTIFFTIGTIIYTKFMQGQFLDYDTVFGLTSGRNWILTLWQKKGYLSYGYGSSMLVIGRYLEMDLVQIYLELNLVCLVLFIYCFFNLCKKNMYLMSVMFFFFLNLLTSSSLPHQICWVILMISVATINKNEELIINENKEKETS